MAFSERLGVIVGQERQIDFANRVGISQTTLSRLLNGKQEPGPDVLMKLCEAGYNVNWLLTGRGPVRIDALGQYPAVPGEVVAVAEQIAKYPNLVEPIIGLIQANEQMKQAFELLKKGGKEKTKGSKS